MDNSEINQETGSIQVDDDKNSIASKKTNDYLLYEVPHYVKVQTGAISESANLRRSKRLRQQDTSELIIPPTGPGYELDSKMSKSAWERGTVRR